MLSLKKIGIPALALLALATLPARSTRAADLAPASAGAKQKLLAKSADDTLMRVNGTPITRKELERAVKVMLKQNHVQQELPPDVMKQAEEAALEQLAAAELLYQSAQTVPVKDLDGQVTAKLAQNRAKFASDAEFGKALQGLDMTEKDMREFARKDIVLSNFINERFLSKAAPSEVQARAFYDENLEKFFKKPESARASHILIGVDEQASAEDHKKAKEKAEAILKRLKAGENFAAIAKSDSSCPSSAQGGDLGNFERGQMVPPFEQAAFALKPGEMSSVVETKFGYHIIKLTEKQTASTVTFAEAKPKILDYLKQQQAQQALSAYVDQLKKTAKIEKL